MAWPCLVLKVGPGSNYRDGDVLAAFTTVDAIRVDLDHRADVRWAGGGVGIPRAAQGFARDFQEMTYQYLFQRVSKRQVERFDLKTGESHRFSRVPTMVDGRRQHMHVDRYCYDRLKHSMHRLFGRPGREFWFGGVQDRSDENILHCRDVLFEKYGIPRERNSNMPEGPAWPAGTQDIRSFIWIDVESLPRARSIELTKPGKNKRDWYVDWRDVLPARFHSTEIKDFRGQLEPLAEQEITQLRGWLP